MLIVQCVVTAFHLLVAYWIPSKRAKMTKMIGEVMGGTPFTEDDYSDTVYGPSYIKSFWHSRYLECFKEASLHKPAPNTKVISLKSNIIKNILDFQRKGRPLVINFGSCT